MAFQPIRRLIPGAIRQAGIEEQVSSVRVLSLAKEILERFWGPEKAQYVEWISYKEGAIKIRAHAPAAKQELKAWEVRFMNELNRALGAKRVTKITE
jgi:hypothetical protein